ncbi:MAG: hypothetical protein A2X49_01310 [Lentisphaerae bacterium GWF2_52_8]|nr:MAG: hypothetical protein A2X49_01310 [Lentisphaerae bacterium GWF2_52_8]
MTEHLFLVSTFCLMQTVATLLFKLGSSSQERWLPSFIVANIIGISSTWLLMLMYKNMSPSLALTLAVCLPFIAGQAALAIFFGPRPSPLALGGAFLICTGVILTCKG